VAWVVEVTVSSTATDLAITLAAAMGAEALVVEIHNQCKPAMVSVVMAMDVGEDRSRLQPRSLL
jgi:3-deoxy-D-arabino-heptulosonate 7-phosphate (DAHP) synthase